MQLNRACDSSTLHKDIWHNTTSYHISAFILIHVLGSITTFLSSWGWISDSSGIGAALGANENKGMAEASSILLEAAKSMISTLSTIN